MIEEQLGPVKEEFETIGEFGPVAEPIVEPPKVAPTFKPELYRAEGQLDLETGEVIPEVEEEQNATWGDAFNISNPFFGIKHNTGLDSYNPTQRTWDPANTDWVNELKPNDRVAVSMANSEEYAYEILARRALYEHSSIEMSKESLPVQLGMGFVAAAADPFIVAPVGVTGIATKAAYTLATKATRIAAIAAESAVVSMASASTGLYVEKSSGVADDVSYGMTNLYAGLLGGGLPIVGNWLSSGYAAGKVASSLTTDPKNFALVFGETLAETTGGTQLRTPFTNFLNRVGLSSDVTFTASSNNQYVSLISNRIDSPPVAVLDRNTGQPVPITTTGQDFKIKFNGRQRTFLGELRRAHSESGLGVNEEEFNVIVGQVVRDRSVRQEQLTYNELNDVIEFTKSEAKLKSKAERDKFLEGEWRSDTPELEADPKIKKPNKKEIKAYDEELETRIALEIEAKIDEAKAEIYAKNQLEFEHENPKVVEAAQKMDDYYKDILQQGKDLKVVELSKLKDNRHYMTRIFDFQKVREMDYATLHTKILKGLQGHAANSKISLEKLNKAADDITKQLQDLDYTRDFADYSFMVPKELGSTAFLKSKKYQLNDTMISDILVTDATDVIGQYSYSQAGHFAANHSFPELQGIPRQEQVAKFKEIFIEPLQATGASAKEVNALDNMFQDLLGTFRIAKNSNSAVWKGTRIANSINSVTYGGAFALNNVAELGGLLLDGHVTNVLKARLGTMKEIGTMFTGKGIDDPLARDFVLMGQFENLFETNSMMKMSDTETVFNINKVENNINKGTSEFFKYTGLRAGTVALEAMVGPKVIHDIMDMGIKGTLSLANKKYLARIGLTPKDAADIHKMLKEVGEFTPSGKIYDMHLEKWDDANLDRMTTAVSRGMRHTVIKGDTTYLPSWMINPNAFNRLAFQFLRYPMAATETLMARGLDENMAKWVAATMTSTFLMSMVIYGREQGAIAMGAMDEAEAKFSNFWEDDEAAMKLFTSGLSKAGTLGGSELIMGKLLAIAGVPMPGHEYASRDPLAAIMGPTFSRVPQLMGVLQPALMEGRIDDRQQWNGIKGMMPGATIPFISEYLSTQIKENTY